MNFKAAGYTNVGIKKQQNQDSYLIKIAQTPLGDVALAAVADGMGGLSNGELASATVVRALSDWFEKKLPLSLETMESSVGGFEQFVEGQWNGLVQELNMKIMRYGMRSWSSLGTTLTAFLAIGARYSVVHVGDSRAYEITTKGLTQLTEDQTYIRQQLLLGNITPEEAKTHPQRNVLLQCLGASKEVRPQIVHGNLKRGASYLLCSDGFRHVLTDQELAAAFNPMSLASKRWHEDIPYTVFPVENPISGTVESLLKEVTTVVMDRKEKDNITALVLSAQVGGRK